MIVLPHFSYIIIKIEPKNCNMLCVFHVLAEESSETLNLSGTAIKKIAKASEQEAKTLVTLILDDNELQRLDCVDSFSRLENVCLCIRFDIRFSFTIIFSIYNFSYQLQRMVCCVCME